MFTPIHSHGSPLDAMRTAFRHAAEAEAAHQPHHADAETTAGEPSRRLGNIATATTRRTWPTYPRTRRPVRFAAALASVVISATLIGSVLLGFDWQADAASEIALAVPTASTASAQG